MFNLIKRIKAWRQSVDSPASQLNPIISQHLEALDRFLRGNENRFLLFEDFFKRFKDLNLGESSPSKRLEWYEVRKELTQEKHSIPVRAFMMPGLGEEVKILLRLPRDPSSRHLDEFLIKIPENPETLDQITIGALRNGECVGEASLLDYMEGRTDIFDTFIGPFRRIEVVPAAERTLNVESLRGSSRSPTPS